MAQARIEYEQTGKSPNPNELKRDFNSWKAELHPWLLESCKDANQQPFSNFKKAMQGFFKHGRGKPRFKKKGIHESFYISNDKFRLVGRSVLIPKVGWIRLAEQLRFPKETRILSGSVSLRAGQWHLSVSCELPAGYSRQTKPHLVARIGIDLGLTTFAVTSEGETFEAPKPLRRYLKHLARLQRKLSRKLRDSKNRVKARLRVQKLYLRISNIRKDYLQKLSTSLLRENQTIVIEDLAVSNMVKLRSLARALGDVSFAEFRRMLLYKAELYGSTVILADRFFPSTKLCSSCGNCKKAMLLSDRVYSCEACGLEIDRDLNAAINLKQYKGINGAVSPEVLEAIEDPAPKKSKSPSEKVALAATVVATKLSSMMQEPVGITCDHKKGSRSL